MRLEGMRANPEVYLLLGILHLDDDRPAEAEQYLRGARALEPLLRGDGGDGGSQANARALDRAARIYAAFGRAYLAQAGRMDAAADAYEQAVRWDRRAARAAGRGPDAALAHTAAMTMIGDGRFAEGLPMLAELGTTAPDPELRRLAASDHRRLQKEGQGRLRDLLTQARSWDAKHEHKPAMDTYLEALRVDPGTVEARERAAYFMGKIFGRYPQAKALVEEGLALLVREPAGDATQRARERLTTLLADLERWDRASAEEEARDMVPPKKEPTKETEEEQPPKPPK
jgi:tetratricopeptide (TPR) repeat protein